MIHNPIILKTNLIYSQKKEKSLDKKLIIMTVNLLKGQ